MLDGNHEWDILKIQLNTILQNFLIHEKMSILECNKVITSYIYQVSSLRKHQKKIMIVQNLLIQSNAWPVAFKLFSSNLMPKVFIPILHYYFRSNPNLKSSSILQEHDIFSSNHFPYMAKKNMSVTTHQKSWACQTATKNLNE